MRKWRPDIFSKNQKTNRTETRLLVAALLMCLVVMFALFFRGCSVRDPIYSAFSDSTSAVRPKALFSYNAFVHGGIQECYLEVFFIHDQKTFLRMQHPGFDGEVVIEFTKAQTETLLAFVDKYLEQLPEDIREQKKAHMVGTFHESIEARNRKTLSIVVDYRFQRLRYRLFFGNNGMSPVLDVDQLRELRTAVLEALKE